MKEPVNKSNVTDSQTRRHLSAPLAGKSVSAGTFSRFWSRLVPRSTVSRRIWIGLGFLVILSLGTMISTFLINRHLELRSATVEHFFFPATVESLAAYNAFKEQIRLYNDAVILGDQEMVISAGRYQAPKTAQALLALLNMAELDAQTAGKIRSIMARHNDFTEKAQQVYMALSWENRALENQAKSLAPVYQALMKDLDDLHKRFVLQLQDTLKNSVMLGRRLFYFNIGLFASVSAITALIFFLLLNAERKWAEEETERRLAELKRSNRELEQFVYVASHDLQEPLRMVASFTEMLARRYRGKLDSEADQFIAFAVDGANRMKDLINDLLEYSRIGTTAKDLEPVDCQIVLNNAIRNLSTTLQDHPGSIHAGPLPIVMADAMQLTRVFQNLISNAVKYRREIPLHIAIEAEDKSAEWLFSVCDNGIGIDREHFERIFVIFQRLHGKDRYTGTGIGLAICKNIVERHGGRIWVDSEPGKGSAFYFTLPKYDGTR